MKMRLMIFQKKITHHGAKKRINDQKMNLSSPPLGLTNMRLELCQSSNNQQIY
ncbi:unnamed protein product [Arabidopsis halleri]